MLTVSSLSIFFPSSMIELEYNFLQLTILHLVLEVFNLFPDFSKLPHFSFLSVVLGQKQDYLLKSSCKPLERLTFFLLT